MKVVLLIGTLFICFTLSQGKKPAPVYTCGDLAKVPPRSCCPSFPKFESTEMTKCFSQCLKNATFCCLGNCLLSSINGTNADGSYNAPAISAYITSMSDTKNKSDYTKLVADSINECYPPAAANSSSCIFEVVILCVAQKIFQKCPDMKNTAVCTAVNNAAKNCTDYPASIGNKIQKIIEKVKAKISKAADQCTNVIKQEPIKCCPSYPKLTASAVEGCVSRCKNASLTEIECCVPKCLWSNLKGFNNDGSLNITAVATSLAGISKTKDKKSYISFASGVLTGCNQKASKNNSKCLVGEIIMCAARELFLQCNEKNTSDTCAKVYADAANCTSYLSPNLRNQKAEKKEQKAKASVSATGKQNTDNVITKTDVAKPMDDSKVKNQGIIPPSGKSKGDEKTNKTSTSDKNAERAQMVKKSGLPSPPSASAKPTAKSTESKKETTHPSQSEDGALGKNGPMFQEV